MLVAFACSETPAQSDEPVAAVASTPVSAPPSATATAEPTSTAIPPTSTPEPPTSTPSPVPTYTPQPTYTPRPTYTPEPTHTPIPTNTPLPPIPTIEPTETPIPMPTSTPEPKTAWLALDRSTDPLTDEESVGFASPTIEHNLEYPYDDKETVLYVRCNSGSATDVFIFWGGQYMAAKNDVFSGQLRWDDGKIAQARWRESTNKEATMLEHRQLDIFISETEKASQLFVRVQDFSGDLHDALFQVDGLTEHLDANADLCRGDSTPLATPVSLIPTPTPIPTSTPTFRKLDHISFYAAITHSVPEQEGERPEVIVYVSGKFPVGKFKVFVDDVEFYTTPNMEVDGSWHKLGGGPLLKSDSSYPYVVSAWHDRGPTYRKDYDCARQQVTDDFTVYGCGHNR